MIERYLFPEQRKWVAKVLIVSGLSLLLGPAWVPIANAVLQRYADFSVPETDQSTGWVILVLGLLAFAFNEFLGASRKTEVISAQDVADRNSMKLLFSNLYLPALDEFFHFGKLSITYIPALHYFYGLEGFVRASNYHVHCEQLKREVDGLYAELSKALSFHAYFVEMPNADLQKFDSRRDIYRDHDAKQAHDDFVNAVYAAEAHMRSLCTLVSSKYPDFDFSETNRLALNDYREHYPRQEEAKPMALTQFEFSVLRAIVDIESGPNYPNLETLMTELGCPRVDVQVGLDKLIEIDFVKHLYPGLPYQKYTALKDGRAFYVEHRHEMTAQSTGSS